MSIEWWNKARQQPLSYYSHYEIIVVKIWKFFFLHREVVIEIVIEIEIIIEITEMMIIAEEVITEGIKGINGIIIEGVTIGLMADGIEVIGIEAVTGEFKLDF